MEQLEQRQLTTTVFIPLDAPWDRAINHGPVGDFNNDGFSDYLVIHNDGPEFPTKDLETRVRLYLGGDDGLQPDRYRELNDEHDLSFVTKPTVIYGHSEVTQFETTDDGAIRMALRTDSHPGRFQDPESFADVVDLVWSDQEVTFETGRPGPLSNNRPAVRDGANFDGNLFVDRVKFVDGVGGVEYGLTAGDANADLKVDFQDFLILANNWGRTTDVTFFDGDFDGDGGVGFFDFLDVANNFGR